MQRAVQKAVAILNGSFLNAGRMTGTKVRHLLFRYQEQVAKENIV